MSKWNGSYYVREGFSSIFHHGFMSFAAVCMIVACLLIMGSFALVAVDLDYMLGRLEDENVFLAYIEESLTDEQAQALGAKLESVPNVASATFVSRETALADFVEDKESDVYKNLPTSVTRHRYSIHVNNLEAMDATTVAVKAVPGVAKISADPEITNGFIAVRNIASGVSVILVTILAVISLFIITNTIKLATFHRREEIAIMKMCGATNGFIRWPFVVEGMALGLAGALVAFFLQWGIYALICNAIAASGQVGFVRLIPFKEMALWVLAVFAGTGFVIGVGGSLLAIRKFLQV